MVSSHIFQFTGNLLLAREASLATWKKAFREKHGDLNLTTCHIADIAAEQLAGELSTPPFLAEKRLTIVHIDWKISVKKQKNEEEGQEEEFKKNPKKIELYDQFDFWEKVIAHIPEDHIVAFVGPENIPPLQEILNRVAQTKKFEVLETPWEIQNYIQNRLPLLSTQGAKLFALRIGVNYKPKNDEPQKINFLLLENEIQKLLLLPEITEKQILENITESIEVQNFKIIDTLLFWAIEEARELFQKYISPLDRTGEIIFINSFLGAMRKTWLYFGLVENSISPHKAADIAGIRDFIFQKYQRFSHTQIVAMRRLYEDLIRADIFIKSGQLVGSDGLLHHIEYCLLKYNSALKGR